MPPPASGAGAGAGAGEGVALDLGGFVLDLGLGLGLGSADTGAGVRVAALIIFALRAVGTALADVTTGAMDWAAVPAVPAGGGKSFSGPSRVPQRSSMTTTLGSQPLAAPALLPWPQLAAAEPESASASASDCEPESEPELVPLASSSVSVSDSECAEITNLPEEACGWWWWWWWWWWLWGWRDGGTGGAQELGKELGRATTDADVEALAAATGRTESDGNGDGWDRAALACGRLDAASAEDDDGGGGTVATGGVAESLWREDDNAERTPESAGAARKEAALGTKPELEFELEFELGSASGEHEYGTTRAGYAARNACGGRAARTAAATVTAAAAAVPEAPPWASAVSVSVCGSGSGSGWGAAVSVAAGMPTFFLFSDARRAASAVSSFADGCTGTETAKATAGSADAAWYARSSVQGKGSASLTTKHAHDHDHDHGHDHAHDHEHEQHKEERRGAQLQLQ